MAKKIQTSTSPKAPTSKSNEIVEKAKLDEHIAQLEKEKASLIEERAKLQNSETDPGEKPLQEIYNLSNRIVNLTREINSLKHRKSIDSESISDPNIVGVGDIITIRCFFEDGEDVVTKKLVSAIVITGSSQEFEEISTESPLGRAVKGKRIGEPFLVTVPTKAGSFTYKALIEAITK